MPKRAPTASAPVSEHEKQVNAYLARLKDFLMVPNHSDDSWPTISDKEFGAGAELVSDLIDLKWARDCDQDSPVRFTMFQRRTHRLVWDAPIRNTSSSREVPAAQLELSLHHNLRMTCAAAACYAEEAGRIQRQLEELARDKVCAAAAVPVFLVLYKPDLDWNAKYQFDRPVSMHATKEEADAFAAPEGLERLKVLPQWAVPSTYAEQERNFAAFRAEVRGASGKVVPRHGALSKLRLVSSKPA